MVQLTTALADRYRIERELGRGGMATVYLAHDLKHDRPVALKMLHPEIAASLGTERFIREVRLTARLQHPHILPVFDSGAVNGRPWYTMPYVRGESLRDRLRREVQLPVQTAVEITRQLALALDYAHREGAVHRDIKPENVLLSESQALVADFGVARAIGAAGEEALTGTGVAIGTATYMAPEQASGGQVDGRTDVYALGCVLYEMLAGEPPFTGPTPQAIVAKRFAHPVPSLLTVRPTVPRTLDGAIRKALAPVPADRFASAAQFAEAVGGSSSPGIAAGEATSLAGQRVRTHRMIRSGAIALAGVAAIAVGYVILHALGISSRNTLLSTGVLRERDQVLIAEFQSQSQDSTVGPAVTEAFRIDFGGSPVLTVTSPARVTEALERMRRPATTRLDAVLAREVAVREGIKAVVTGQVTRVGASYLLSAQLVSAATGEVLTGHREAAPDSTQVIAAIDRLSGRLRESIGESLRSVRGEQPLEQVTTSSLEALWKYTEGLRATDVEYDCTKAVALLEEAVALDTGFATAYRTLGLCRGSLGDREGEVAAVTKAVQHRDRLTELEREHTRAFYYAVVTGELEQLVATYQTLLERYPDDSVARNNLGVTYYTLHQPVRAESILRALLDTVRPWSPIVHINIAMPLVALGRQGEAERIFLQAAALFPGNRYVESDGIPLIISGNDYVAAAAAARAYRDRHASTPVERIAASRNMAKIAAVQGRLAEAERYTRDAMAAGIDAGRPAEYLKDAAVLALADLWFRRQPARGLRTVEAGLARYPLTSLKPVERPYLDLAILYAAAGRPQQARALLTGYERAVDSTLRRVKEPMRRWAWGQVALAEGRYADAIAAFQAYAPIPRFCLPCGQAALAQAYDRLGNADSAIAVYERYVTTPSMYRLTVQPEERYDLTPFGDDATQLAPAYKRLGELYEQRGDQPKARHYYSRFVGLWKDADPELRPAVVAVGQRLRQLGGESSDTDAR